MVRQRDITMMALSYRMFSSGHHRPSLFLGMKRCMLLQKTCCILEFRIFQSWGMIVGIPKLNCISNDNKIMLHNILVRKMSERILTRSVTSQNLAAMLPTLACATSGIVCAGVNGSCSNTQIVQSSCCSPPDGFPR